MDKTTYVGIFNKNECETQTLLTANYMEDNVSIIRFTDVHGGKSE